MYYPIDEATARRAKEMMSFSDYKEGSATAEYRQMVDQAAALVERKKQKVSPFYHDKLDALLDRYSRRMAQWTNDHNRNGASCPSVLICGPANFPTKKKARQNARDDTLWREYQEIQGILDKIKTIGTGPVDLTDPHAREILEDRIRRLEGQLDKGKKMNAHFRKHKTLRGFPGLLDDEAAAMDKSIMEAPAFARSPFPDFELASLRNKIKTAKNRLADLDKLEAQQEQPQAEETFPGGRVVHNAEENRLQILFYEIPDADTRAALKSRGFRWSPKNQAWQRQLTRNAEYDARQVLELLQKKNPPPVSEDRDETDEAAASGPQEQKQEEPKTGYNGFRSVEDYEKACTQNGFTTRRVPFHKGDEKYFLLITTPPGHPTGSSIEHWVLFTADTMAQVLDGNVDGNYLDKLAADGYYPDSPEIADTKPAAEEAPDATPAGDWHQFTLFT